MSTVKSEASVSACWQHLWCNLQLPGVGQPEEYRRPMETSSVRHISFPSTKSTTMETLRQAGWS